MSLSYFDKVCILVYFQTNMHTAEKYRYITDITGNRFCADQKAKEKQWLPVVVSYREQKASKPINFCLLIWLF